MSIYGGKVKNVKIVQQGYVNSVLIGGFILVLYGFISVLTPNLKTFDSSGFRFLALSLLNILVLGYFIYNKKYVKSSLLFFKNKIGIAYTVVILLSLLSFVKAINIHESILHFSKIFTVFIATWFVSIIISLNKKALYPLSIMMCVLLLFDCFYVFGGVSKFIKREIVNLGLVKSVYSNKNILTSSLFIKIPFSLVLFYFYEKKAKLFGGVVFALSVLATLFMSSRAFYLAIITMLMLLSVFSIVRYKQTNDRFFLKKIGVLLGVTVGCFLVFTFVQSNLYPKAHKGGASVLNRLSSIAQKENISNNLRLTAWKNSFKLIKREPILGVGLGNWKVRVLEYENQYSPNYIYVYKAHNDFIEVATESGVLAGVCYALIFVFVLLVFIKVLLSNNKDENFKWYFLFFFGMVCYFFDASFNFPQDRPEVQVLFAIIIGGMIGLSNVKKNDKLNEKEFKDYE